ncbi:hypothetical protein KA093_00650 [Candidatus Saccharibacteria bacterium]|nr:hypothetical protein [Candidatus Saccharibacteria bacterium]
MKRIRAIITTMTLVLSLVVGPALIPSSMVGATPQEEICKGSGGTWSRGNPTANPPVPAGCINTNGSTNDVAGFVKSIINLLLYILGAIAVLMIVIGGIRYTTSGGDQSGVKGAKDTILYAVIGLVVAMMAYAIVNFVVLNVK